MDWIVVAASVGAGLVTGLLFAFSNFVMQALAEVPAAEGMRVMQRVNERIINPVFVVLFLGTPALCAIIAVGSLLNWNLGRSSVLLAGALLYLAGPFGITMLFNVPLNNRLARIESPDDVEFWASYQVRWQRWNHVRTILGVCSMGLLAAGLAVS